MSESLYMVDYPRKSAFAESALIEVTYDYDRFTACPECGRRVSGAHWMQPREVVLTSRKVPDFLYSYNDNAPFLLSRKALETIRAAGLTGIRCAEEIEHIRFQRRSKTETPIPTYYHIELERSRITLDHGNSVIQYGTRRYGDSCPLCRQVPATYVLPENSPFTWRPMRAMTFSRSTSWAIRSSCPADSWNCARKRG